MTRDKRDEFLQQIKNKKIKKKGNVFQVRKKTRSNRFIIPKKSVWGNSSVLFSKKGSVTVEAALVIPIFLIAVLLILSLIDAFKTYEEREYLLYSSVKSAAVYGSIVTGTDLSIMGEDEIKGELIYPFIPGVKGLGREVIILQNKCVCHIFNGYDVNHSKTVDQSEEYVYVTETGTVYHTRRSCSHLNVTIMEVAQSKIGDKRNEEGSRYKQCPYCAKGSEPGQTVFITSYGNKYHKELRCSALKRSIRVVKKSECNLPKCKECGDK